MKITTAENDRLSDNFSNSFFAKTKKDFFFSKSNEVKKSFFSAAPAATIQPKLTIGQTGDKFEQEADQMADFVVNNEMPNAQLKTHQVIPNQLNKPGIQRLSANRSPTLEEATYSEEDKGTAVQPLRNIPSNKVPLISKKQLDNNSGLGTPLRSETQQFMESKFGTEFNNVRIHDSEESAKISESISARAFTYGNDIYFNKGEYQPHTKEGNRVLAHELTHVVQQGGANKSQSSDPNTFSTTGSKIQRIGGLGVALKRGVAPWQTPAPIGTNYTVQTDAGSVVTAWVAYSPYTNALRFWCHGHSLGTYDYSPYGFSVYSGPTDMGRVIADEWTSIPPAQTRAGDIAVWTSGYDHSAKFVTPGIDNGNLNPVTTMLSTKNGQNPLTTMSLAQIMGIYGSTGVSVFRHK